MYDLQKKKTKKNMYIRIPNIDATYSYEDMRTLKTGGRDEPDLTLIDEIMLTVRRYEMHNEKVIKYFVSKYGKHVDDYLLILDFAEGNPWEPLMKFLKCHPANSDFESYQQQSKIGDNMNVNFDIYDAIELPTSNIAPNSQVHDIIPKNMTLDWQNHTFSERYSKWVSIGKKYYEYPYSMEYKYFTSVNDSNYINLYASLYQSYSKVLHN